MNLARGLNNCCNADGAVAEAYEAERRADAVDVELIGCAISFTSREKVSPT